MIDKAKLAKIFSGIDGIVAAYLFGSQVKGKTDLFSDYDFAVLLWEGWQKDEKHSIVGALLDRAFSMVGQDKADVVDLSNQPLWFQQVVVNTGLVIYETNNAARLKYEKELGRRCIEAGLPEYAEEGQMRTQDVQIHFDTIAENLQMLETLSRFSYDEFMAEFWYLQSTVHLLQITIEALVDVSRYVIRSLGLPSAQAYWEVPTVLADAGYFDETSAATYVQMVRFRNLIVHHYYRVEPTEIYDILTEKLPDIQKWRDNLLEIIEVGGNN
ncbi:MAG: DUF86 domain-containing protein [Candidatus Poribacteria bacterium]|nr:DUF86 domain-containing protein [Candidatus Poribacteria bacterium]